MPATHVLLTEIVIGDRVRKDMGDIDALAASIERHGLLHPIVIKTDNTLVAGHRRIEAARLNGWSEIPVTVIDVEDLLSAERDENAERKDFTPTEAVAIGRLIEEQTRPDEETAHKIKVNAGKQARDKEPAFPNINAAGQRTSEVASKAVGMSHSTYFRAKAVVAAAESDPEKFGDLPAKMDESGNVSGAHLELTRRKGNKDKNGKKARHPVHYNMRYPKPNREMDRAMPRLDGICDVLEKVDIAQLEKSKCPAWAVSLKEFASRLNRTARSIANV